MDRRAFFRRAIGKLAENSINEVSEKVEAAARHWIRPPFAATELEFLLNCTRCHDCISACEYDVIFPLAAHLGASVVNTPAMDLLNKACHLCDDWPCVTACKTAALSLPEMGTHQPPLPVLAQVSIDQAHCLPYNGPECGVCESSCPIDGALQWSSFKPTIISERCTGCALCRQACIVEPRAILIRSLESFQNG